MTAELLAKFAEKLNFKPPNQKRIRECATTAALETLIEKVEYQALDDAERDILQDIAFRLMLKYFNGREMELLTFAYTQAEAVDITLERYDEVTHKPEFAFALAQTIVALDEFFKAHDKKG